MKTSIIFLFFLLSLIFLQGCYRGCPCPEWCLPEKFREECEDPNCPAEYADLGIWWVQFNDDLLTELIEKSFECSYDIRIARERVIETRAIYQTVFSTLFPQINLNVFESRTRGSQTLFDSEVLGPAFQTLYAVIVSAFWELDFFGKNFYAKQGACLDVMAARDNVRDVIVTIISEIARAYLLVRGFQESIQLTERSIKTERLLYELALERFRVGLTSRVDVYQAEALLETREATLPVLEAALNQTIYALSVLVGELPEELLVKLCPFQCIPCAKGKIPLGLPSDLLYRRGDVRRAERDWQAAGFRVASAKASRFPTFSLTTAFDFESNGLDRLFKPASTTLTFMPAMTQVLFDAGRIAANIKATSSRARQLFFTYERAIVNALAEVESGLVGYCREYQHQEHLEKETEAYRKASILLIERYRRGLVTFTDVLEIQRLYYDASFLLIQSKQNLMVNLVSIYRALGGGWEECCSMQ